MACLRSAMLPCFSRCSRGPGDGGPGAYQMSKPYALGAPTGYRHASLLHCFLACR